MVSMDRQLSAVIRALLFDAAGTLIEPAEPVAEDDETEAPPIPGADGDDET